jgi:hypothetical protein
MDQDTIAKIAAEITKHLPTYPWWVLLSAQAIVALVAAGVGALAGGYLKTRGTNFATKADFETLLAQLRANTELVETIKAEVSQKDWAKREWVNLRRAKLEILFEKIHNCMTYLKESRSKARRDRIHPYRDDRINLDKHERSLDEAKAIVSLYVPELRSEMEEFAESCAGHYLATSFYLHDLEINKEGYSGVIDANRKYDSHIERILADMTRFETAGRKLLIEIMGIAPPS